MALGERDAGEQLGAEEDTQQESQDEPDARPRQGSGTVVTISLLTNIAAMATAFAGAALTESVALLGAGLLAAADAGAQAGLLIGSRHDRRLHARSAEHHPLDTRRHRLFWLFAPGIVLMTLAGVATLGAGADRFTHPLESSTPGTAAAFAAAASAMKAISLAVAVLAVRRALQPDNDLLSYLLRAREPEPAVMVRQEASAAVALLAALATVTAAAKTGIDAFDTGGAMAIGALLAAGAVLHLIQMKAMLVASPAGGQPHQSITAAVEVEPSVVRVVHLEVYHLGPQELLVGVKVELIGDLHTSELADTVRRLADSIRRAVPTAHAVYVEPDAPCSTALEEAGPLGPAGMFASGGTYVLAPAGDPAGQDVEAEGEDAESEQAATPT